MRLTTPKSKIDRKCYRCKETIRTGDVYLKVETPSYMQLDRWNSDAYCKSCATTFISKTILNQLRESFKALGYDIVINPASEDQIAANACPKCNTKTLIATGLDYGRQLKVTYSCMECKHHFTYVYYLAYIDNNIAEHDKNQGDLFINK